MVGGKGHGRWEGPWSQNLRKNGGNGILLNDVIGVRNLRTISTILDHSYIWVFPRIAGKIPKSSILIGFGTIINHPFWGTPIFGNTHIYVECPQFSSKL